MPCAGMPRLALVSYPVLLFCPVLPSCFISLRCLFCRLALLRCPASSCRFALPRYHARLTALSCGLARPPYLTPPSCLSYRLVWYRCLAPFYDLASPFLTPLRLLFSSLKNDFPYPLHPSLPLLRGALMFYSSGFAVY